jgi:3'(2'), 5'-bisphosphate nucleotidase
MTDLLDKALAAARDAAGAAAEIILHYWRIGTDVDLKGDDTPVTVADREAELAIRRILAAALPEAGIYGEEYGADDTSREWLWLVDPLDGTREFVKRNGEFTVNIALIEHHRAVAGVVLAPVSGDTYYAAQGAGAWRQASAGDTPVRIRSRPVADTLGIIGSHSNPGAITRTLLERLGPHERVPLGSSLKFCVIARGDADLYLRLGATSEWDTAAAQCVLEEAGGAVLDLAGRPFRYNTRDSLINPEFIACGDTTVDWAARLIDPDRRA